MNLAEPRVEEIVVMSGFGEDATIDGFEFTIRDSSRPARTCGDLAEAFALPAGARFAWFVPHDDDFALGSGLLAQAILAARIPLDVVVTTDGRMGYCRNEQIGRIAAIRREEMLASAELLGLSRDRVHFLDYPDGQLMQYIGIREAAPGTPAVGAWTGLEASYTCWLRTIRPTHVLTPASSDLHPDHQVVHKEILISVYHARGSIWPDLGTPCDVPVVYEYPLYVELAAEPTLKVAASPAMFQKKLDAIHAFRSQEQIDLCVDNLRAAGPVEFFRKTGVIFYHPRIYDGLFPAAVLNRECPPCISRGSYPEPRPRAR